MSRKDKEKHTLNSLGTEKERYPLLFFGKAKAITYFLFSKNQIKLIFDPN
ncbi:hypothetical protein HX109_06645 [Galbibacter sp. BG1]|nr:hypothetical protein [Galbibacter sp. BG1]QLE01258.1 hypothetical protein HX109_06645 [Galbibacter sp. BG1]